MEKNWTIYIKNYMVIQLSAALYSVINLFCIYTMYIKYMANQLSFTKCHTNTNFTLAILNKNVCIKIPKKLLEIQSWGASFLKFSWGGMPPDPLEGLCLHRAWCALHTHQVTPILFDHGILQMANQIWTFDWPFCQSKFFPCNVHCCSRICSLKVWTTITWTMF